MKPAPATQHRIESALASSEHPGWLRAGYKLFFVLAFFPILMMIPAGLGDDADGLLKIASRFPAYGWTALGLASVSGLLYGLHKLQLKKSSESNHPSE